MNDFALFEYAIPCYIEKTELTLPTLAQCHTRKIPNFYSFYHLSQMGSTKARFIGNTAYFMMKD